MSKRYIVIDGAETKMSRKALRRLLKWLSLCEDFYQLLALSVQLEARLHQIKPQDISIDYPFADQYDMNAGYDGL